MAQYSVTNSTVSGGNVQQATTSTYKSMVIIANSTANANTSSTTAHRGRIFDILVGTNATPADAFVEYSGSRVTYAASNAITTTGNPFISSNSSSYLLDIADAIGSAGSITINTTVETDTSAAKEVWYVGVNQRASYRWVAAPGSELVYPANSSGTSPNGWSLRARSGGTPTITATVIFSEL